MFASDVKARLLLSDKEIFYYPDVMVTCDPRDTNEFFKEFPKVIIEVLSDSTERIDRSEKFWNYTKIETLEEYILASQDKMEVTIFRRSQKWKSEVHRLPEQEFGPNLPRFQDKASVDLRRCRRLIGIRSPLTLVRFRLSP